MRTQVNKIHTSIRPKNIFDRSQKEIGRPCGHPSTGGKQKELTLDVEHLPIDSPWMLLLVSDHQSGKPELGREGSYQK